ncbi:GntR family transcriptional regulator [Rhodococcus sp. Leaf7]|uniref:FadR/GntR family transcriptional regulator n=1 Tax=unclassified Rhodococcus (in: high G+C Gram-positive bacteria) TaxID=192944 RepID=UPI0006FAA242|nr:MULTISPECIES: FCD domain-containing protein [unclassified Rhodococcus (in: high G+C Gram-positive bacteria)]KQU06256.1 GntR family transcriptional regulator [Rhodococcus sp. Leaf7]KQU41773.1 GntR family transcriptional regulator [Rhodococcus sp. Leaf247]
MQPVRRQSLIGQVTDQLRGEIESGNWPVGARIPTEPELTELTGTGRNTVREAVQALVHAGMLERRQGSGTYVTASSDVPSAMGKYFSSARRRDVFELRRALDTTAATLAAERRTDDDVRILHDTLARRTQLWDVDRTQALHLDVALHRAIVAASHNSIYLEVYDFLLPSIEETIVDHSAGSDRAFHDEHAALVHAVVAGDADAAATAARCFFTVLAADGAD